MNKRNGLIAACFSIILTSFVCLALYRYDNKYERADTQPVNGILYYADTKHVSFLSRQWMVCPGVLLKPDELSDYKGYRCYEDIGSGKKNSPGSMTYRLTIILPDVMREYALELPEIFSSCRLYINNRLMLQTGNPDPEHYEEGLCSRIVTFSSSGKTELLIQVSDFSGVHLGLTYPPAFGSPNAVFQAREARILLHGGLVLLSILGALLGLCFGLRTKKSQGILTCLLCLLLAVVTGYPIYHGLIVTKVQPWYTLEPVCYYALLLTALMIQCEIYDLEQKKRMCFIIPGIAGLCSAALYFGAAAFLPAQMAWVFSGAAAFLKLYTAFCLLLLTLWALQNRKPHSVFLLSAEVCLSVSLIWDRLLPLYEPVYGGWFGEIGAGLLVLSLSAVLWLDAIDAYRRSLAYEMDMKLIGRQLSLQRTHYRQLSEQIQLVRQTSHDMRHHMRMIRGFADQKQWGYLLDYLKEYELHLNDRELKLWSEHPTADAILSYYAALAREADTSYHVQLTIPPELDFPDQELCIILGNLLENALDAVRTQKQQPRKISIKSEFVNKKLGIVVQNTFQGDLNMKNGTYYSSKHSGIGYGLGSVRSIAEKHGGIADFSAENGWFIASVWIPLQQTNGNPGIKTCSKMI